MIALLQGEVAVRRTDHVVILCASVGYRAAVSAETLRHVPPVGEQATLHAHLIVRDDALSLYGFHSEQARELIAAIAAGDAPRFQAVPGIGKRTAERIIVELREKVIVGGGAAAEGSSIVARRGEENAEISQRALARDGLLELGYGPAEAEELLSGAEGDGAEELIAHALRVARAAS
jgi:Holliday junction DNA helicase RuvA